MKHSLSLCICFAAFVACGVWAQNNRTPSTSVVAQSVADTSHVCGKDAPHCPIIVRVVPDGNGCAAIVDVHSVRVAKEKLVKFMLVKGVADTHRYRFHDEGLQWPATKPGATELYFKTLVGKDEAHWMTGKKKSKDLGYVPNVFRDDETLCGAGDPTIANDG